MNPWRTAAAVAVVAVGALLGGAAVRLVEAAADPRALVALALLGIVLIVTVVVGTRVRRLSTAYW